MLHATGFEHRDFRGRQSLFQRRLDGNVEVVRLGAATIGAVTPDTPSSHDAAHLIEIGPGVDSEQVRYGRTSPAA